MLVNASRTIAICAACALLIGAMSGAEARAQGSPQSSLQGGLLFGYEFGVPLVLTRGAGTINGHVVPADGRSYNNTLRVTGAILFPRLLGERFGLGAYVSLLGSNGLYHSEYQFDRDFDPVTGAIVPSRYQLRFESTVAALDLDLRAGYAASERLAVELGGWATFPGTSTFTTTLRKLGPLPAGAAVRETTLPDTGAVARTRAGAMGGVSLRIPFDDFLQVRTGLYGRLDLGALADGLGIRSASAGVDVGIIFGDFSGPDTLPIAVVTPPPPPDTARVPDIPRDTLAAPPPALAASIDIYSLGSGGQPVQDATIASQVVRQRRQTPFPAAIFFDRDSAAPPARYVRSPRDAAHDFTPASLARRTNVDVYCRALDLLGLRLAENPAAALTLTGRATLDEPADLARRRAESVRDYLTAVWGIEAGRIAVRTDPRTTRRDAADRFDRCVRVESSIPAVTAPVTAEWLARLFQLPPLDIQPAIKATAGVRSWDVTVRQGSEVVTHYSNRPGDRGSTDLSLHIPDDLTPDYSLPPLVAELTVIDSAGATTIARDSLALAIAPDAIGSAATPIGERSSYLLLPGGGVPEFQRPGTAALRDIAATVRTGDRVTVTDRSGRYGADLAESLRRLLKTAGVRAEVRRQTEGAESGADTPEGALLAGGVTILIEHGLADSTGRQ